MFQPLINITRKTACIFAGFLVLYEFLTYIANDMIMPGMIEVVNSFQAPQSAVATSLTAYILGGASLQLFLGPISDRFGRRPVMLFGAMFFFVCTALITMTHSIDHFLIARFFQGMGLCFISVIGYATLQEIFAEMDAIRLIAIMTNIAILAPLLGPLAGAMFIHYYSWRYIFIAIAIFAIIALWGLWRFMPESVGEITKEGKQIQKVSLSPKVVFNNYKELFKHKSFMLGSIALGMVGLPCIVWIAFSPIILIKKAGLPVLEYGIWQIPIFGAAVVGNWLLQKMTYKLSIIDIIKKGSLIMGTGLLLMYLMPFIDSTYICLIPGVLVYFFGVGIVQAPLSRWLLFSAEIAKGTVAALMTMIGMLIQAIGIEIGNKLHIAFTTATFGNFCAAIGIIYFIFLSGAFYLDRKIIAGEIKV